MATQISPLCIKRLKGDWKLLKKSSLMYIDAYPNSKDILTWYFLLIGPDDSDYKGGQYIGKIIHSPNYPLTPPDFMMLTPNGRFAVNKKICLTNSGYHSDEWSPTWTIKAILQGFLSIMLADVDNGISHIRESKQTRKRYALESIQFNVKNLNDIYQKFNPFLLRISQKSNMKQTTNTNKTEVKSEPKVKPEPEVNTEVKSEPEVKLEPEVNTESKLTKEKLFHFDEDKYLIFVSEFHNIMLLVSKTEREDKKTRRMEKKGKKLIKKFEILLKK